mgnify:CR=1 FL=1
MNIDDLFLKFCKKIKLTSTQRQDAITKHSSVCKKLHDRYYPDVAYDGSTKLLIGSYGKKTNIRPPRDVDALFIMPPEKFDQYDDNQSNGQSQLLQDVKGVLSEKFTTTEKIKAWGKVVLVKFSDGTHDVELLPAWELEDGTFTIPSSENGGSWENWNPRAGIKRIKDSDAKTGKTKKLIRMGKKWSENCSAEIKSYQIEDTVVDFFELRTSSEDFFHFIVKDFFEFFLSKTFDDDLKSHLNTGLSRATKAFDFVENGDLEKAANEYKKIFGDDFPGYKKASITFGFNEELQTLLKSFPSEKEEFLHKDYGVSINLDPSYSVKIDAMVQQDGFRPRLLSNFIVNHLFLKKQKRLTFRILKNSVPEPFQIMWKVRNFGDEARTSSDLRGEITPDQGLNQKLESTKYLGEHYVECYVIKDNVCVAFDRILVPIGGTY